MLPLAQFPSSAARAVRAAGYRDAIGLEFMPLDQDDARAVEAMLALGVT